MLNKKKLKKLEAILSAAIETFEKQESGKHQTSTASLAYDSGLNLLLTKDSFKTLVTERNKTKTAKITRAAKNLLIEFEDFGVTSYLDFSDRIASNVKHLNIKSKLSPVQKDVEDKITEAFQKFELECDAFYNSMLMDIFNQGRQHQMVANPGKSTGFRKFASFEYEDNKNYEAMLLSLKDETLIYLSYLRDYVNEDIHNSYVSNYNKSRMLKALENALNKSSGDMQDLFRKHSWQAYSFGNLYQLEKDKVELISWKTGHHLDDCLTCRAFQTGDAILKDENGNQLEHFADADTIAYKLSDISKLARIVGPTFFCHEGCRCQFISYDKKPSF